MTAQTWFDEHGFFLGTIPADVVKYCTRPGMDATEEVRNWIEELGFSIPATLLNKAKKFLDNYGAWDVEELTWDELNEKVFWIACGDLAETGEWSGLNS